MRTTMKPKSRTDTILKALLVLLGDSKRDAPQATEAHAQVLFEIKQWLSEDEEDDEDEG